MSTQKSVRTLSALAVLISLGACGGGGGGGGGGSPAPTFDIGGTVSGLSGTGLVLQNNGGNNLSIADTGAFTFSASLESGDAFDVTVSSQPASPTQTCTVANGSGTVASADVTNVAISCTTNTYTVGGVVSGLDASSSGLTLQNGAGNKVSIAADGAFSFPGVAASGEVYDIRVLVQPTSPVQSCTVENGRDTVTNAAVSVQATCLTQHPRFATSLDFNDASYSTYVVDAATGQLRPRGHVRTGANPVDIGRDVTEKFTYVLSRGDATLSVFTRDAVTGELAEVPGSPYPTGAVASPGPDPDGGANTLTAHPLLGFVYVANGSGTGANNIAGFAVDGATGELSAIAGSPFAAGTQPFKLTIDASGRFAYAVNRGSNDIYTYSINQTTGALTEVPDSRVSTEASPAVLTLHANGRFAYVPNTAGDSISAFTVDASTGKLTPIDGSPFVAGTAPATTPMIHPNGKFLYLRNVGPADQKGSISAFAIDATSGALTAVGSALEIGENSSGQWLDPAGEFLFVANRGTPLKQATTHGSISMFRIGAGTGELTALTGAPDLQPAPYSVSVDPSGQFVYSASAVGNWHRSYSLDRTTGKLTPLEFSPVIVSRAQPISLIAFSMKAAPEPAVLSSKFAYVSNQGDNTISGYSIDPDSGALTTLPTTSSANGPGPIIAHPNGRFVLAGDTQAPAGSVSSYGIDVGTGALSVATSTLPTGGHSPTALAFNPNGRFVYLAHVFAAGDDPRVAAFGLDPATGALAALPVGSPNAINTGEPPIDIAVAPNGRFVHYITDDAYGVGRIDPITGGFSAMSIPVTGVADQSALAIGPNGRYAYIAVASDPGGIERFRISWDGALEGPVPPEAPVPTGSVPRSIAIDPTGRFLYTANSGSDDISAFKIIQDGDLELISLSLPAGGTPVSVAADYSGKYLYVLNDDRKLVLFTIDTDSGALDGPGAPVATGLGPVGLALSTNIQ